jgi:hypothetical protein
MVRAAVGYKSRAFVTFGQPIEVKGYDPQVRRDVMELAHHVRDTIGRLMKVVPTSIVASCLRPSIARADLKARVSGLIDTLVAAGANMASTDPDEVLDTAADLFNARGIIVVEGSTFRVRDRNVLKYYARTIEHLLPVPPDKAH